MANAFVALVGRLLFAFLFIASGIQKLHTFNLQTGGSAMKVLRPKLESLQHQVQSTAHGLAKKYNVDPTLVKHVHVPKEYYPHVLGVAIFFEIVGAVLFVMNKPIGAWMLVIFVVQVTVVMHDFWNQPPGTHEQYSEMVHCFKNVALLGGLLSYIGMYERRARH